MTSTLDETDNLFVEIYNRPNITREDWVKAQRELAALKAANRWIPVTERLPEPGPRVHVWDAACDTVFKAYRWPDGRWMLDGVGAELFSVTHWRPLPEPPQDGQQ